MTRKELAKIIGVDVKTLSNWENEKPALIRLINLGIQSEIQISETRKLLGKLEEIELKASSGKLELK